MRALMSLIQGETKMNLKWKSSCAAIALAIPLVVGTAHSMNVTRADGGSPNGAAGEMPAFHDGELLTINIFQLPKNLVGQNPNLNMIFATNDLDTPQEFIPVIDAIQGQDFLPLWRQFLIEFNPGFTPRQFTSAAEVEQAASGPDPEITLIDSGETYRCAVVGPK
jgi:hypothetical protein